MKREIKFRAWDKATREYWNIDNWHFEDEYLDLIEPGVSICDPHIKRIWRKRRDVELMQYTGLKDVRGVEIYEGDIVEGGIEGRRSLIEMSSYEWLKQALEDEFNKTYCNYKIIGNKFENPELLEG